MAPTAAATSAALPTSVWMRMYALTAMSAPFPRRVAPGRVRVGAYARHGPAVGRPVTGVRVRSGRERRRTGVGDNAAGAATRKDTRLNSRHEFEPRMPDSAWNK